MRFPLAEFRPDLQGPDTGFTNVFRNVYPTPIGCRPILGRVPYSEALPGPCRGGVYVYTTTGDVRVFAATQTALYKLDSDLTWASVGSGYAGPGDDYNWAFEEYYGDLYALNENDGLLSIDIDAGSSFALVADGPPGKYLRAIEGYLFIGALTGSPNEVAWCDTADATNYSTGNSGSQIFARGGPVTGLCAAAKRVMQEHSEEAIIHQPGGNPVFAFVQVAEARGCIAPYSLIEVGDQYACLAEDGFYFNGSPIGKEKVDEYFFGLANTSRLFATLGGFDPLRRVFRWAFHTGDGTARDWQLIYNPTIDRWSECVDDVTFIAQVATPGVTLEGLGILYPDLDVDVPFSLDSRIWQGGRPTFAVFGTDDCLSFYEGDPLEATVETTEAYLIEGWAAQINGAEPLVTGDTGAAVQIRVGKRMRLADSVTYTSYSSMQLSGRSPLRAFGKYMRFALKIAAGTAWTQMLGVVVQARDIVKRGVR